jgi:hypothetical protein
MQGDAQGIAVSGSFAYVGSTYYYPHRGASLRVIDISTPWTPLEVGFIDVSGSAGDVAVSDGYVFLVSDGLAVFRECGGTVFEDGFESGDTSAWSATVP